MDLYSSDKILFHIDKILDLKDKKPIVPIMIELHLEAYCNDNCDFCSFREENGTNVNMLKLIDGESLTDNKPIGRPSEKSRIPYDVAISLPKMMNECGIPACIISGGGESTLYPKFDDLLDELIKNKIESALITNGSGLNKNRVDKIAKNFKWIRFSMDSSDQETHKKIHRTPNNDFDRRLDLINQLVQKKKEYDSEIVIGVSYVITNDNYNNLDRAVELYKNVDSLRFSFASDVGGLKMDDNLINQCIKTVKELKIKHPFISLNVTDESDHIKTNDFKSCHIQHFNWVIGADSMLYPCCVMAYHPNFAMADLRKTSLASIVNDKAVHDRMFSLNPKQCMPCWLRDKNQSVEKLFKEPKHSNFC